MSKPSDFLGASPKTVLNKPFMHVQDQKPQNTAGGTSVVGENPRDLNTVLSDQIAGASLLNNEVILPAGTYYIEALTTWDEASSTHHAKTLVKAGGVTRIAGSNTGRYGGVLPASGELTFTAPTTISLVTITPLAEPTSGLGQYTTQPPYEVYSDLRIWKLDSNVETIVVSDPEITFDKPFMHVQDRKATGESGGTSVAGINPRVLNTVLTNEISGATLSGDAVTLPAGTYRIKCMGSAYTSNRSRTSVYVNDVLTILGEQGISSSDQGFNRCSDRLVLTESSSITVKTYTQTAVTTFGLGVNPLDGEEGIYVNLEIWQLDAVIKQPVLLNDNLYPLPGNTLVTGNMHGLEYAKTGDNQVTVQAGICKNSTNETVLQLATQQAVSVPTAINTIYNLFLCDDGIVRVDTDVDGATLLGGSVTELRWIGFVRNNASGVICDFTMIGDRITFDLVAEQIVVPASISTSWALIDYSFHAPLARCTGLWVGGYGTSSGSIQWSYDAGTTVLYHLTVNISSQGSWYVLPKALKASETIHIKGGEASQAAVIHGVDLKR